jgi:hypothetical protein
VFDALIKTNKEVEGTAAAAAFLQQRVGSAYGHSFGAFYLLKILQTSFSTVENYSTTPLTGCSLVEHMHAFFGCHSHLLKAAKISHETGRADSSLRGRCFSY